MPPRGYKKSNPDEQQQLLTAARSIVSVLCASAPDNMDLRMADSCLENAERSLAPAPAFVTPLLAGEQA